MVKRREFLGPWLVSVLVAMVLVAGFHPRTAQADEFSNGARIFIDTMTEEAITMLTGKDVTKEERAERFRTLMNKNFSIQGIAKFVLGRHLRKATWLTGDEVIGKVHEERLVTNSRPCTKDGVTQPQRLALPDINTRHTFRNDILNGPEQLVLPGLRQRPLEFRVCVEMIFDSAL